MPVPNRREREREYIRKECGIAGRLMEYSRAEFIEWYRAYVKHKGLKLNAKSKFLNTVNEEWSQVVEEDSELIEFIDKHPSEFYKKRFEEKYGEKAVPYSGSYFISDIMRNRNIKYPCNKSDGTAEREMPQTLRRIIPLPKRESALLKSA